MHSAATIRLQIEASLAYRIPSALTPRPRIIRYGMPTGVAAVDELLNGGLPAGAITEMVGPESCGRTSLALSSLAQAMQKGHICPWSDACDALNVESAAAAGVDLSRLLWVRCGIIAAEGPIKNPQLALSACRVSERESRDTPLRGFRAGAGNLWKRMEQALEAVDLLLQSGGFSVIVLDMGDFVRIAAFVIARQRPGTAKGLIFLSIEDETGIVNVIVSPDLYDQDRLVVT